MKKHLSTLTIAVFLSAFSLQPFSPSAAAAPGDGPELGLQAYTFRKVTLSEALDRAVAMKIKNIQAYGGQKISPKTDEKFSHNMSDAAKAEVRALFKTRGLNLTSYGVVTGKNEDDWRKIFAFAKEMGLRDIATEPKTEEHLPLIAKLSAETGILVTLHNHAQPPYGDPDVPLDVIKRYGKNFGLCADTGHWARSGYDPVATLKKTAGKITSIHFKDITERLPKVARDMPWGTGSSNAALQILELRRQGFKGIAYMEYENDLPQAQLDADTAASAEWFHRATAATDADLLAGRVLPQNYVAEKDTSKIWTGKRGANAERWPATQPLFAKNLSNADMKPGSWEYKDGTLTSKGNGDIWTKETYGDFALNLDFRCDETTDTGVIFRCANTGDWEQNALEVQIVAKENSNDKRNVGGVYDISAPRRTIEIAPGQWHHITIIAQGAKIQVTLNGERVTDIDLSKWKKAGQNPDGTKNKYKKPVSDMAPEGRIGLQSHKTATFRNIVIERIAPDTQK